MALAPQDRPRSGFAAGEIDQAPVRTVTPPRVSTQAIPDPVSLIDRIRNAPAPPNRVAAEQARSEAVMQGALWGRHRDIEALTGRRLPVSMMMSGQDARDGVGQVPDDAYEASLEQLRQEFPEQLAAIESRADLAARLSGNRAVTYYQTPYGDAEARTASDGRLVLSTRDGRSGSLRDFPGARPVRRAASGDTSTGDGSVAAPRQRSLGERFSTTASDVANTNPIMALGRYAATRGPAYDEFEDPENPGETIRYASFGTMVRDYETERRDSYRLAAASDPWDAGDASFLHKAARGGATLLGALGGSAADPTSLIAPGRTIAGRIIGAAAVNTASDVVAQASDIGAGVETEYNPMQTAASAVLGTVIQGGVEGGGALARNLNPNPGGVVGALASEIDAGSRSLTADPAPAFPPAVRAALSRIDQDRMDELRLGPVDGATRQAVQSDLDALRTPMPSDPVLERELDDLFGERPDVSPTETVIENADGQAPAQPVGPADRQAPIDGGPAVAGVSPSDAPGDAPAPRADGHIDSAHADLARLAETGDRASAEALSARISNFIDWDDVDLSAADREAVNARLPVSADAMLIAARNYEQAGVGSSMYDPDSYPDAMAAERAANPVPAAGPATTAPGGTAGFESVDYQGRRILSGSFDPMAVDADPARFQFKQSGDEGLTDRLAGVTQWDRTAAGRSILYEESDGRVIIADGHQRRGLARRLIASGQDTTARLDGFLMRARDGWTPAEVRIVAALKNLREDSGSLLDAAKVLREAPNLVNDRSLPITGEFLANARGLAPLADDAFDAVSAGVISDRNGALIGEMAFDRTDLHLSMVDLIRAGEPRSLDETRALIQEARLADFVETQGLQGDMFGGVPAQSTLIARARLRAAVLKQLRGDARLFGQLVRNADAIEAGGNALARNANEARLARDLVAYSQIDKLALRVGQVGDTFGDAAAAITRGDMTMSQGAKGIVDELREATRLADQIDADRRVNLDPSAPSPMARQALSPFDEPGGRGQVDQARPKPEDAEIEARASQLWDDLPEVTEEQRALDVLRVCAPRKA